MRIEGSRVKLVIDGISVTGHLAVLTPREVEVQVLEPYPGRVRGTAVTSFFRAMMWSRGIGPGALIDDGGVLTEDGRRTIERAVTPLVRVGAIMERHLDEVRAACARIVDRLERRAIALGVTSERETAIAIARLDQQRAAGMDRDSHARRKRALLLRLEASQNVGLLWSARLAASLNARFGVGADHHHLRELAVLFGIAGPPYGPLPGLPRSAGRDEAATGRVRRGPRPGGIVVHAAPWP